MMRALALAALVVLTGCAVSKQECIERCAVSGERVVNWIPGFMGACQCASPDQRSAAERFCSSCASQCAPLKAITCKFGNDTWGAGPDVCECERRAP